MRRVRRSTALVAAGAALLMACERETPPSVPRVPPLFALLSPESTGVAFVNALPERPEFNILNYLYFYNGGGVAVGDIDGDGLQDLYFTSNVEKNRLYRNLGDFRFEDITDRAGVGGAPGWTTGVTMADIDGDGHVDLYVSGVSYLTMEGRNILYLNNGDGTFTDRTEAFGLGHVGYSTQALFFDYDGDGDLDMYLLNHSTHTERAIGRRALREVRHPRAGDRLFRNDGGRFTDVSATAGIYGGVEGYGLGVVASDLTLDGCPDVYVANDFQENDYLYVNNCDGTFTESITRATGHTSRFSMGVDAADINNDGRADLLVLDMLPQREEILKTSASSEGFNLFDLRVQAGYHPQYARNTLQLNRGTGRFSDIGYLAGVHATDWSWAGLIADLDNDGWKDLFITNGIVRRPNDLDYINYVGNEAVQASLAQGVTEGDMALLARMPQIPLPNHAFRNGGDLRFEHVAEAWGLAQPGFSNGAAYVDLDNDGALDLVVNNINAPATIYRNRAREVNGHGALMVTLRGGAGTRNTAGFGTKLYVTHDGVTQYVEQSPTRGFQSSVDPRLHVGLGMSARVDSLVVVWPDSRFQVLRDLPANRPLTLHQDEASGRWQYSATTSASPIFEEVTRESGVAFRHEENDFLDYNREPLMPHRLSTEGPALAAGDVNGDGLDDFYVGGAKWQAGRLYLQKADGTFRAADAAPFDADSLAEDVDALFFDADGDGDLDLYVVSGGNEFWGEAEALRDRLYVNDGTGRFTRARDALPDFFENGSSVVAGDFDGDGDLDLFVGSRVVTREYGRTPRSRLLQNDGTGRFRDVTAEIGGPIGEAGMVTAAAWVDVEDDGHLDLVVVGEWMPLRVYSRSGGTGAFTERTAALGLGGSEGWWNSLTVADVNADGRPDFIVGGLGLNSYIRASAEEPARLYVHDFGATGSLKQMLTFHKDGVSYPMAGRDELVRLIPALRSRYPSYAAFGASRVEEIFSAAELRQATVLEARQFATSVALSGADGRYTLRPLPVEAQFAPVFTSLARDLDGDGHVDLLLGGNFHGVPPMRGRYDASQGLLLRGDGLGGFRTVDAGESGVAWQGEVRRLRILRRAPRARASRAPLTGRRERDGTPQGEAEAGWLVVVARNNDTLQLFTLNPDRGTP